MDGRTFKEDMKEIKKEQKAESKQKQIEAIENYDAAIDVKKSELKQSSRGFLKSCVRHDIRVLRKARFEVKYPVLHAIKTFGKEVLQSFGAATGEFIDETKKNYENLSPMQKGIAMYVAVDQNIVAGAMVTNLMAKYSDKKPLTGLKEQNQDKGNGMDY